MAARADTDKVLGIVMIILGALLLVGSVGLPFSTELVGVALVVVAIMIWVGSLRGSRGLAILIGVVGILLLLTPLPFVGAIMGVVGRLLDLVVGIVLVVFGVLKLMR